VREGGGEDADEDQEGGSGEELHGVGLGVVESGAWSLSFGGRLVILFGDLRNCFMML
jgi:hypothetical protein